MRFPRFLQRISYRSRAALLALSALSAGLACCPSMQADAASVLVPAPDDGNAQGSAQRAGNPAIGSTRPARAAQAPDSLPTVTDAWVRWLPAGLPAAGYMTLTNTSGQPARLDGASSPDFGEVMLHQTVHASDRDTMTMVDELDIGPGKTVRAQPGASDGYHWMLLRPTHPIVPGTTVSVHLHFADGRSRTVPMIVSPPTRLH